MSILIHGMEMPKNCLECPLCWEDEEGMNCCFTNVVCLNIGRQAVCPLIELPPHGRLGDLDALLADHGLGTYCPECKRDERSCQFEMIHTTMDFCGWIEDAPTIIPADPGGGADG